MKSNSNGFTLIEVMVSLVIGAVLIVVFSGALINGLGSERRMDKRLEARRINEFIIETLHKDMYLKNLEGNLQWQDNYKDFKINFKDNETSQTDITVSISKSSIGEKLYFVFIEWPERNYHTETLLAGE